MKSLIPLRLVPLLLVTAAGGLRAADADSGADVQRMNAGELMALMEFVGGWENSEGEWIDAMSLEAEESAQEDSGEDHEN